MVVSATAGRLGHFVVQLVGSYKTVMSFESREATKRSPDSASSVSIARSIIDKRIFAKYSSVSIQKVSILPRLLVAKSLMRSSIILPFVAVRS